MTVRRLVRILVALFAWLLLAMTIAGEGSNFGHKQHAAKANPSSASSFPPGQARIGLIVEL